jgi:hypothetical protein
MRPPLSSTLRRRLRLPHPVVRRTPADGTAGLRNLASRGPVRVGDNHVFGKRLRATTGNTTSSDDEFSNDHFFPDIDNLFGNLNMGDNVDAAAAAAASAANARPHVFFYSMFQILLEFLLLLFGVHAFGLSCLDVVCSSILLICMISLSAVSVVIICQVLVQINSYGNYLIFSTLTTYAILLFTPLPFLDVCCNIVVCNAELIEESSRANSNISNKFRGMLEGNKRMRAHRIRI